MLAQVASSADFADAGNSLTPRPAAPEDSSPHQQQRWARLKIRAALALAIQSSSRLFVFVAELV